MKTKTQLFWNVIKAKSGVLFLKGKPGVGKTQKLIQLAQEQGLYYIDLRLSQKDETEVTGIPVVDKETKTFSYAVPQWAYEANNVDPKKYKGCLVVFEELNRASSSVRKAAMQILLERQVGEFFKLKDNVYMAATGNLGDEDNCDVDEFDDALNNRLISVSVDVNLDEWISWAKGKIHPMIISYLSANPGELYKKFENAVAYATPRSWEFLSNYIKENYGLDSKSESWVSDLEIIGSSYIGNSIHRFLRYVEEQSTINFSDILNKYSEKKEQVAILNRSRISEILQDFYSHNWKKLTKKQTENLLEFFRILTPDEKITLLNHLLLIYDEQSTAVWNLNIKKILLENKEVLANNIKNNA